MTEYAMKDLVGVVRCKDCKHYADNIKYPKNDCAVFRSDFIYPNGYCSNGERKDDAN